MSEQLTLQEVETLSKAIAKEIEHSFEVHAKLSLLKEAIKLVSLDMHTTSTRPCNTCAFVTNALGEPFGCYQFQDEIKRRIR